MNIEISGQHIDIGASLKKYVSDKIDFTIHKYFEKINESIIVFKKRGNEFVCHISVPNNMGMHFTLKGEGISNDPYSSFDEALSRIEKQLRKYKSILKSHNKVKGIRGQDLITPSYVSTDYIMEDKEFNEETGDFDENFEFNVIDSKVTDVLELDLNDAIMKMDFENLTALVFVNNKNNRINVVYRDNIGRICLVDPTNKL